MSNDSQNHKELPSFLEALRFWLKLGFISFGGPAGQIAIMHRELVESKRWMDEKHFMNGLNFCMLLPGPEAQQLATYLGWRLHGAKGGVAAGVLFFLPSVFILLGLSWLYIAGESLWWVSAIFHGLLGAVIAVILDAVIRIGKKSLRSVTLVVIAAVSFVGIFFFHVSFIAIVLSAGIIGLVGATRFPKQFPAGKSHGAVSNETSVAILPPATKGTWARTFRVLGITIALWWLPVIGLGLSIGWDDTLTMLGLFFSKAAMVTIGGAYAVLPYVAQQAVETHHWLDHTQMMSGLALAESTPGPLIMVLQFVGFLAAYQNPGDFNPWVAAVAGSAITVWVTFLPCFMFVFLGAPWIEKLGEFPKLSAALMAITASVVGVILNLGVKFSEAALWGAEESMDWFVAIVALTVFALLHRFKVSLIPLLACSAVSGVLWRIWIA